MTDSDPDPILIPFRLPKDAVVFIQHPDDKGATLTIGRAPRIGIAVHPRHARAFKAQLRYLVDNFEQNLDDLFRDEKGP